MHVQLCCLIPAARICTRRCSPTYFHTQHASVSTTCQLSSDQKSAVDIPLPCVFVLPAELPAGTAAVSPAGNIYYTTVANEWIDIGSTTSCPIGYTCAGGNPAAVAPVACDDGSTTLSAGSTTSTACGTCGALFFTQAGHVELVVVNPPGPRLCRCKEGYSAQPGTSHENGNLVCVQCSIGSYKDSTGDGSCTQCTSGTTTQTTAATSSSDCRTCPSIFASNEMSLESGTKYCRCAAGYAAQINTSHEYGNLTCTACAAGYAKESAGDQACHICPIGNTASALSASTRCNTCNDPTTTRNSGTAFGGTCDTCASFFGSTSEPALDAQGNLTKLCRCKAAYYAQPGTSHENGNLVCVQCTIGSYKDAVGDGACTPCAGGTTKTPGAADSNECNSCSDGDMFGLGAALDDATKRCVCGPGYSYTSGSHDTGNLACTACSVGWFKNTTANAACTLCSTELTTKSAGGTQCKACLDVDMLGTGYTLVSGSFCVCDSGYYYVSGSHNSTSSDLECQPCALGTYKTLKNNGATCTNCSTTTTTRTMGAVNSTYCQPCSVLFSGAGLPTLTRQCACGLGHYYSTGSHDSDAANLTCRECDIGFYKDFVGNAQCTQCSPGNTTKITGSSAATSCRGCSSAAIFGTGATLHDDECVCDKGYSSHGSHATADLKCTKCLVGYYKEVEGNSSCMQCSDGTTTKASGAATPGLCLNCSTLFPGATQSGTYCECDAGHFAVSGAHNETSSFLNCDPCPLGFFKSASGNAASCTACGANTTTMTTAATLDSECRTCSNMFDDGTFLNGTQCQCAAGYYNSGSHTATSSSLNCIACVLGSYKNSTGAGTCTQCISGYTTRKIASTDAAQCKLCNDTSMFGSLTQLSGHQCVCIAGHTNTSGTHTVDSDDLECEPCPIGSYKSAAGNTACTKCSSGTTKMTASMGSSYCLACLNPSMFGTGAVLNNSTHLCMCNGGYYSTGDHSTTAANLSCTKCAAGSFKASPGNGDCSLCPVGSYQVSTGSTSCTSCTAPLTTNSTGSTGPNECKDCSVLFPNSQPTLDTGGDPKICQCESGFYNNGTGHATNPPLVCTTA